MGCKNSTYPLDYSNNKSHQCSENWGYSILPSTSLSLEPDLLRSLPRKWASRGAQFVSTGYQMTWKMSVKSNQGNQDSNETKSAIQGQRPDMENRHTQKKTKITKTIHTK